MELEFSCLLGSYNPEIPFPSLAEYERMLGIHVKRMPWLWHSAWDELLQAALHAKGPDISEVGTTWVSNLSEMQALRPFSDSDVALLGGANAFAPGSWQTCVDSASGEVFAIPWYLDMRFILYRRDWLQKAQVEESTAFQGVDQLYDTLRRLKAAGFDSPLSLPTTDRLVHNLACFLWGEGGNFRQPDGRKMMLGEPEACRGATAYFGLNEFVAPELFDLREEQTDALFGLGRTGVAITSERLYFALRSKSSHAAREVVENLGVALMVGAPFIGGANLVIWKYAFRDRASVDLIRFLTGARQAKTFFAQYQVIPARLAALNEMSVASDPVYALIQQTLAIGRSFRGFYRWAGVETRLNMLIKQIWTDLLANPGIDLPSEISGRMATIADQLDRMVLAS